MLRPWEFKFPLKRDSDTSIQSQIIQAIVEEIRRGRLPPGAALPGTRQMADRLGVNRKTVVLAYEELVAQGWLATQGKRGTFVSPALPTLDRQALVLRGNSPHAPSSPGYRLYGEPLLFKESPGHRGVIEFRDGVPDTRLIPFDILSRAFRHALVTSARANRLGYDDPRGSFVLRRAIASMLNMERGLNADEGNICVVRGSQMGIFLAARILVRPGDHVVLEHLSYPPARAAFQACGAAVLGVGQDHNGMLMDELEALCRRHHVRAVYTTPHHQFPTTAMMSAERRMKLLMLAEQFGFAIIEDDYDHEFHFSHRPILPLASADRGGKVIYIGSLSKVLAPGLRVGYVVAHSEVINHCAAEIMLIDRQGNSVTELAVAELMTSGELRRHIRRTMKIYEERRNLVADLMRRELAGLVQFDPPEGGLAFWLRLAEGLDVETFAREALAERALVLPGPLFSDGAQPAHAIRLGFGNLDKQELADGVARLKRALARQGLGHGALRQDHGC